MLPKSLTPEMGERLAALVSVNSGEELAKAYAMELVDKELRKQKRSNTNG